MKSVTEGSDINHKLKGLVDDLYLLQLMKNLCAFSFIKTERSKKIGLTTIMLRVVTGLYELDKKNYRECIIELKEYYYHGALKLEDKGQNVRNLANAIETCIIILDSDSEEWKKALKTKLQETKTTLKKMLNRLKEKEVQHKKHKSSPAVEVIARVHQQRRQQHSRADSMTENTSESTNNNGC